MRGGEWEAVHTCSIGWKVVNNKSGGEEGEDGGRERQGVGRTEGGKEEKARKMGQRR